MGIIKHLWKVIIVGGLVWLWAKREVIGEWLQSPAYDHDEAEQAKNKKVSIPVKVEPKGVSKDVALPKPKIVSKEVAAPALKVAEKSDKKVEAKPGKQEADDLTKIEGIGPSYQKILYTAGIKTYADLAGLSEDQLANLLKEGGARKSGTMHTWLKQASLAAAGQWDELKAYQDEF